MAEIHITTDENDALDVVFKGNCTQLLGMLEYAKVGIYRTIDEKVGEKFSNSNGIEPLDESGLETTTETNPLSS